MTMVDWVMETSVPAGKFKARCLAILDEVAETHVSVVVTKYGRPVARLVPIDAPVATMGSVTLIATEDEDYFTTGSKWDAES